MELIFSVYDSKASAYLDFFKATNIPVAVRMFEQAVQDPNTNFNKYPGDFTLFHIGFWECVKGEMKALDVKVNLGTALEHQAPDPMAGINEMNQRPIAVQGGE